LQLLYNSLTNTEDSHFRFFTPAYLLIFFVYNFLCRDSLARVSLSTPDAHTGLFYEKIICRAAAQSL